MIIAIKNVTIVTVNKSNDVICDGLILIESNKINYVGPNTHKIPEDAFIIDGREKVAMPGLINCHTHAAMTYLRGVAEDKVLMDWLNDVVWPAEEYLKPEHVFANAMLACLEMIKSGTTTFVDQYFHVDETFKAVENTGIRAYLAPPVRDQFDYDNLGKKIIDQNMQYFRDLDGKADDRVRIILGPHAPYTCSRELLDECKRLSDEYDLFMHIHISEVQNEITGHKTSKPNMTNVEFLDDIGFLSPRVIAAHTIWLTDKDIEILKRRGVKTVHNPTSNMKISAGIAPVAKLLKAGVPVALGTDSAASNNRLDMFEAMKTAALLQKVSTGDPTVLPAETCLRLATIEGAKVIGAEDRLGSIEEGKLADIILLDFSEPHLQPWHKEHPENTIAHIVYSACSRDVCTVIINGKIILQDRSFLEIDEYEVIKGSQKAAKEILYQAGVLK